MGGLYTNEISFVQFISLYLGVNGVCIDVTYSCIISDK